MAPLSAGPHAELVAGRARSSHRRRAEEPAMKPIALKQTQGRAASMSIASLAIASVVAVACGHPRSSTPAFDEPDATVSTTVSPADTVVMVGGVSPEGPSVCEEERDERAAREAPPAVPTTISTPSVAPIAHRRSPRKVPVRAPDTGALDEAIRGSVLADEAAQARQDATPPHPESAPDTVFSVTNLTGATVPRAAPPASVPSTVTFANELPTNYELQRVRVFVDGAPAYDAPTAGTVRLAPGAHDVAIVADYHLRDPVFTYVRGYGVEVQSRESVVASPVPVTYMAAAVDRGGITTPMEKRASLAWRAVAGR
jgi:hypothetical protein